MIHFKNTQPNLRCDCNALNEIKYPYKALVFQHMDLRSIYFVQILLLEMFVFSYFVMYGILFYLDMFLRR